MRQLAIKFEDATDADLQAAVQWIGAEGMTAITNLLLKPALLKKERSILIRYLRSASYKSLLGHADKIRPMHQTVKDAHAGADFLNALGYIEVDQLCNFAQRTLRFNVLGNIDQAVSRLLKANRTYTQLGFKLDCKDVNQYSDHARYDEHTYQVLDGPKLMGFMVLRWHHGSTITRIELCPNTGS